jgi:hypothetical protein
MKIRGRRGFTLVELAGAVFVLGATMALTVQVLGWVAAERRTALRRQWALREADNLLERITSLPYDRVATAAIDRLKADGNRHVERELPGGHLDVQVAERATPAPAKQIVVEVHWRARSGGEVAPVRLTAWVYDRGGN